MIISHRHKFIFIKTRKTAGTSIEISLSRYCDDGDILTPFLPAKDEALRASVGKRPLNYRKPLRQWSMRNLRRFITTGRAPRLYWNHMSAAEVKRQVGDDVWNSYYKFCFERNPWDKTLSFYYHRGHEQYNTLDQFLRLGEFAHCNYDLYTMDGHLAVDRLGWYETLQDDLYDICKTIGIPFDGWLPDAKSTFRTDRQPYWEALNAEQLSVIRHRLREECELFERVGPRQHAHFDVPSASSAPAHELAQANETSRGSEAI
jgi:hypothetical protein